MSSSSAAPTISFSGLASGIDTSSVIATMTTYAQQPITQEQAVEAGYNNKLTAWQDFNIQLASLQSAATALTLAGTYQATTASSSNTTVASITSTASATIGNHSLTVLQTAQAQKVVSGSFTSGSTAMGLSGTFTLNGKTIQIASSDALTDIAAKINAAGAGASAQVVNVGTNDFRMTLSSNATGTANALSLADGTSSSSQPLLVGLGLLQNPTSTGYTTSARQTVTSGTQTGAASISMNSATQTVANTLGLTSVPAAGSVTIGGQPINIDLSTDSLNSIAAKINAAGISGVSAQVVAVPDANGNVSASSQQQLEILGSSGTPTLSDSGNILSTLGVTQGSFQSTLLKAQDSTFSVDGLQLTRSSNVVNDAIPGASINLLGAGTSTLSVAQDTSTISSAINTFVTAYNAAQDYISGQNVFTSTTTTADGTDTSSSTPALFGDSTLQSMQQQLGNIVGAVSGSSTLASIGITFNTASELVVDSATLTSALQTNAKQVFNLFGLSGLTDNSNITFVSAGEKAATSTGAGFAVNITTAATQASGEASTAHTSSTTASTAAETLTFGGTQFSTPASITLPTGNTLQDTVNQINTNSSLNGKIYASIDQSTNKLVLSSIGYGTGNSFSVSSSLAGDGTNSGIGTNTTVTDGTDVAGTINGEPATGKGQTLTGKTGNATTEGITLLVTGTQTGTVGHVAITHGVADAASSLVTSLIDPTTGGVIQAENALNSQITDAQTQITQMQAQVTSYTAYLTQMFSDMETRVSELQSQGSALSAALGTTSTSSSSTAKTTS
jgi:flagellar hook-associated protein 2